MSRIGKIILILILCVSLVFQVSPASAADEPNKNEPTYNTKYTVKKIKKPPYCVSVNGNENEDFSTEPWIAGSETKINIVGQKDDDQIAGEWQFYVTFSFVFSGETVQIEGVEGSLVMGLTAQLDGTAKGTMIDIVEQKKKEKEEKKNEWQPVFPSPKSSERPKPVHTDSETIRNSQEAPKELYMTEFDVDLSGTLQNLGSSTVYGQLSSEGQTYNVDANILPEGESIKTKGKVKIMIDSNNNAVAYLESDGKTYGPYAGVFTCQEDLDIQRKDSGTWPIWGVWTDVNPYEPMPDVAKDAKTVADQLKRTDEPKKIKYPEGRWVALKQGKKDEATTYVTVQVSKDDITYETGEIWPYPGSAMFKPTEEIVYSKDLQKVLKTSKPMDYELVITYHTANDTITYPYFGTLVRVRNADLLGIWSSAGDLPKPDVSGGKVVPPGTWYEFVRGEEDTEKQTVKGYSAAYTFTRIISNKDKSVEMDKGTAIIMPIGNENTVLLTDIKSEKTDKDGNKTELAKENESLPVSDYSKSEGTVKFGGVEYTSIPGFKLSNDKWSTLDPPVNPPDAKNGSFLLKDENGDTFEPPSDSQWIRFDNVEKVFVWTQMIEKPEGILVRSGKYKTYGEDLLLLTNIKGSFYAKPGTDVKSFDDKDYMFGEKLLHIKVKTDDEKNPVKLSIAGVAEFSRVK